MGFEPIIIREQDDLLRALECERRRRGLSTDEVDHYVGLTRGQTCKTENGGKRWGRGSFRMTPTIGWLLEFFGFRLVLMRAEEADLLIQGAQCRDLRKPARHASLQARALSMVMIWRPQD